MHFYFALANGTANICMCIRVRAGVYLSPPLFDDNKYSAVTVVKFDDTTLIFIIH